MILNGIHFDIGERSIFRYCVDKLGGVGKSDKSKKVGDSTMYREIEL